MSMASNAVAQSAINDRQSTTVTGWHAFSGMNNGSRAMMRIKTPFGQETKVTASFNGFDRQQQYLCFTLPRQDDQQSVLPFFYEGMEIDASISSSGCPKGLIHFKSIIEHVVNQPVSAMFISLPVWAEVLQNRKSQRTELEISAQLQHESGLHPIEITDMSTEGCCFQVRNSDHCLRLHAQVKLYVKHPVNGKSIKLSGQIKRRQFNTRVQEYGVQFFPFSTESSNHMLRALLCDEVD